MYVDRYRRYVVELIISLFNNYNMVLNLEYLL